MVPPKYNFYIGELKENFATRPGSISTAGIYEENSKHI